MILDVMLPGSIHCISLPYITRTRHFRGTRLDWLVESRSSVEMVRTSGDTAGKWNMALGKGPRMCIPRAGEYLGWTAVGIGSYWVFQTIEGSIWRWSRTIRVIGPVNVLWCPCCPIRPIPYLSRISLGQHSI